MTQDAYAFTIVSTPDTTPPYTSAHNPQRDATGVSAASNVVVPVFDDGTGVDLTTIVLTIESVDVTSLESQGGWRELLGGAGVKSASISGSGVFKDATTDERARAVFFNSEVPDFQIIVPDFGTIEGAFMITGLDYAGSHNGEATYELAMASAGELTFTAL